MSEKYGKWQQDIMRPVIEQALKDNAGNVIQTAKALGAPVRSLYYVMDSMDIDPNEYRSSNKAPDSPVTN